MPATQPNAHATEHAVYTRACKHRRSTGRENEFTRGGTPVETISYPDGAHAIIFRCIKIYL